MLKFWKKSFSENRFGRSARHSKDPIVSVREALLLMEGRTRRRVGKINVQLNRFDQI